MADQSRSKIIEKHPIGKGLDAFRSLFSSTCEGRGIISRERDALDQLDQEDVQDLASSLLSALQILPATRLLTSKRGRGTLRSDLLRLISAVASADFDFDRVKPLLKSALTDEPDDALIWDQVYNAVAESTPPPRPIPSSIQQTPWSQNTSGFVSSSEFRQDVDPVLKLELERLYVGLPNFHKTFFGDVPDLDTVSEAVFGRCTEGDNPLFKEGWSGWLAGAKESDVLTWFGGLIPKLEAFAGDRISTPAARRKLLAQPRTPLGGSAGKRSMDPRRLESARILMLPLSLNRVFRDPAKACTPEVESGVAVQMLSAWIFLRISSRVSLESGCA